MVIYVLAYPEFGSLVARRIDRFRSIHEPERAKLVPPHITLVFGLEHAYRERIAALFDVVSNRTPELAVQFETHEIRFDPFEQKYKMFLICGKGRDALTAMHNRLYQGAHRSDFKSEQPYRPHMTIASDADRATVENLDVSEVGELPIPARVGQLALVQLVDETLITLRTASLRR